MPLHVTREVDAAGGRDYGLGPRLPVGFVSPIAVQMGLGFLAQTAQPDRLRVSEQVSPYEAPTARPIPRYQDPRAFDAGRLLDFGAPAPTRVLEYAPLAYRPTEAPADQFVALGGRLVGLR